MKTWSLLPEILSGCVKTLLVLLTPGSRKKLTDALVLEVCECFVYLRGHVLSDQADRYRETVLRLFSPRPQRRRAHATLNVLASLVFNSDWQGWPVGHIMAHICSDCCPDGNHALECVKKAVPKLVRALKFKMFSHSDWESWAETLSLIGFLSSMHALFGAAFTRAL